VVPKNNWYCPHCLEKPDTEYGFEDGRLHTIESYKKQADAFKEQYFAKVSPLFFFSLYCPVLMPASCSVRIPTRPRTTSSANFGD